MVSLPDQWPPRGVCALIKINKRKDTSDKIQELIWGRSFWWIDILLTSTVFLLEFWCFTCSWSTCLPNPCSKLLLKFECLMLLFSAWLLFQTGWRGAYTLCEQYHTVAGQLRCWVPYMATGYMFKFAAIFSFLGFQCPILPFPPQPHFNRSPIFYDQLWRVSSSRSWIWDISWRNPGDAF